MIKKDAPTQQYLRFAKSSGGGPMEKSAFLKKNDQSSQSNARSEIKTAKSISGKQAAAPMDQVITNTGHKISDLPQTNTTQLESSIASEVRHLAQKELRRGRPLAGVFTSNPSVSNSTDVKFISGFDLLNGIKTDRVSDSSHVDWKILYQTKDTSIKFFFGPGNSIELTVDGSLLKTHDKDGSLLHSMLGINAPGALSSYQAEGLGTIVACIKAGFLGPQGHSYSEKFLQMLSPDTRNESLRHGLILSCYHSSYELTAALLKLGASPNVNSDDDESMPLEVAIRKKNYSLVQLLLTAGATPDIELSSGMTCRGLATLIQDATLVSLLSTPDVNKI